MNGYVVIPIILGTVLLAGGAAIAGVAIANGVANAKREVNEYEFGSEDAFTKLKIDLETADFEIKLADDGKTRVVCEETEKYHHAVKVENGELRIDGWRNRKWYEYIMLDWSKKKVTLFLPETSYANLSLNNSTGDISVPKDFTFENATVHASTGDIKFEANVTHKLNVGASTGRVYINGVDTEELKIGVSTGDVETNKVHANSINIKSSTGNVNLVETVVAGHLEVETSTGHVRFNDSDADTIKVKTSTGSVRGTLLTGKDFTARSSTGRVNVPNSTGGKCEVYTSTGDIVLDIKA